MEVTPPAAAARLADFSVSLGSLPGSPVFTRRSIRPGANTAPAQSTTRICAELGAHFVKTYYCEPGFETVTAACPVPLVMAGGKKLPERDALTMAYRAIENGAAGVDMGRNIFQSDTPQAMIRAVGAVVHESAKPDDAYDQYLREPAPAG